MKSKRLWKNDELFYPYKKKKTLLTSCQPYSVLVFLHPLFYKERGGVGGQGSTQQTLDTVYTDTQQPVLERTGQPEEPTQGSGAQIWSFFFRGGLWHKWQTGPLLLEMTALSLQEQHPSTLGSFLRPESLTVTGVVWSKRHRHWRISPSVRSKVSEMFKLSWLYNIYWWVQGLYGNDCAGESGAEPFVSLQQGPGRVSKDLCSS